MSVIAERYRAIRQQVADAADCAGRHPDDVRIIAVTKTVGVQEVRDAIKAGMGDFGENRVQEFLGKYGLFPDVNWHFIGSLQTNKVADVVGKAYLIHSVDSLRLLQAIDRQASAKGVVQPVLLQVNVSGEESKHGFAPEDTEDALLRAAEMPGLVVRGLMTMAPLSARVEDARPVFHDLASLVERLRALRLDTVELTELSMGMTNDFKVAVEEGSTMVRVGRAIFGK